MTRNLKTWYRHLAAFATCAALAVPAVAQQSDSGMQPPQTTNTLADNTVRETAQSPELDGGRGTMVSAVYWKRYHQAANSRRMSKPDYSAVRAEYGMTNGDGAVSDGYQPAGSAAMGGSSNAMMMTQDTSRRSTTTGTEPRPGQRMEHQQQPQKRMDDRAPAGQRPGTQDRSPNWGRSTSEPSSTPRDSSDGGR